MNAILHTQHNHIATTPEASQTATPLSPQLELKITVVGGGFCGTTATIHLLRILAERSAAGKTTPKLIIQWFDKDGLFGRGLAYQGQDTQRDDRVLILNQPASLMSPFASDPNHYARWLSLHQSRYTADSFTPRAIFGEYLQEILAEAERAARSRVGPNLEIRRIQGRVSDLSRAEVDGTIIAEHGIHSAQAVILASGHARLDQFEKFSGNSHYIDQPFAVASYRNIDLNQVSQAIIVGGGPSSIDAVRILEELGFAGHYSIAASRSTPPWPFYPRLYTAESFTRFKPKHLVPEVIPENPSLRELHRLLGREIRDAWRAGFGCGHALYGISIADIERILNSSSDSVAAREFGELLSFLRGNVTAPENVKLRSYLRRSERLHYVRGRAEPELSYFEPESALFAIPVRHRTGRLPIVQGELFINCALYPRSHGQGLGIDVSYGQRAGQRVLPVGPALQRNGSVPRTWGVESFREEVRQAAERAFAIALADYSEHHSDTNGGGL